MAEHFYTILTNIGKASIANATAMGTKVDFKTLVLGDGNGQYYNPTEAQESLKHEVWRGNIANVKQDAQNPNWISVETVVPGNVGGFMIREAGILDEQGQLLLVGKYPETYKPTAADGSVKDIMIRLVLEVSNAAAVTLKIDPTAILATMKDILNLNQKIDAVNTLLDHKADKNHKHTVSDISDLSTALGNIDAKTLESHPASYFAKREDVGFKTRIQDGHPEMEIAGVWHRITKEGDNLPVLNKYKKINGGISGNYTQPKEAITVLDFTGQGKLVSTFIKIGDSKQYPEGYRYSGQIRITIDNASPMILRPITQYCNTLRITDIIVQNSFKEVGPLEFSQSIKVEALFSHQSSSYKDSTDYIEIVFLHS